MRVLEYVVVCVLVYGVCLSVLVVLGVPVLFQLNGE